MSELVSAQVEGGIAIVEMHRPPSNFFDEAMLAELASAVIELDAAPDVRAIVLCSEGKHFCAGADLRGVDANGLRSVYRQAFAIFTARKPIVAAVQGAAVGGGLGLALAADFRVATGDSRFTANFARLGFHHGFGLSVTLPAVVGRQRALDLLYTGRSIQGAEAFEIGLCDRLVESDPREAAVGLAMEIAESAPLSLLAIRATMRRQLVADVHAALDVEATAQSHLLGTADFGEGVAASVAKRQPEFVGR
ncbi:enoyl-CoA hydratase/isomerase family protein [Arthrobacter bambusae]|uniref:enoyl-CoA hydratase/isomerase family protein n=1 Tax=Arthrobacter bambusae TaxID=1338426 RepID=UPI001F50AA9B|nr:enoyl-CoA hydratase/isomerase family protein [Arthrobacter bambusae]MCI0143018.1 enoyl-CoA hydratase/isomerase family protein [Arthrobacter bambusae]